MTTERKSVLEQMAQDARHLRRARMLPTDRPLTPEEINQVARDYKKWEREHRISRETAAKTLGDGFSAPTLSAFLNGHNRGDTERIARGLNEYMERHTRAAETKLPEGFVETEVARSMLTVVRLAVDAGVIGTIVGPAGVGKTLAIQAASKLYTGSIYFRVTQSTRRGPSLAKAIAKLVGVRKCQSFEATEQLLIEALKGSNRPLFVDEGHELNETGLAVIRDIHDCAGIPIVLVGTKKLTSNVDDSEMFFGQFSSRIGPRYDATELALRPRNPQPLYRIDEIIEMFGKGSLRLTDDGAQFLTELACLPGQGSLRLCAQLVRIAARLNRLPNGAADASTFRGILKEFHGVAHSVAMKSRLETRTLKVAAG
jgi:DNA transposition AAA+ family ATPase